MTCVILSKATHPELLELLAKEFTDSGYDIKHVIRCIVSSSAYQRTSKPLPANKSDKALYSHAPIKVMSADMLYDSLQVVLNHTPTAPADRRGKVQAQRRGRGGPREQFRNFFHAEADDDAGVTEEYSHGIPQVLRLMNDANTNNINGVIAPMMKASATGTDDSDAIPADTVRPATSKEVARMKKYLKGDRDQKRGYSDIFWALLK